MAVKSKNTMTSTRATALAEIDPPSTKVENNENAPIKEISSEELRQLGQNLNMLFQQYVSDRRIAELRWLRNQRQYLGLYDPEVEKELAPNRSKAYPRITRVKCISVMSRLMNLMFPGNERNWELKASPDPDITLDEVKEAIAAAQQKDQEAGTESKLDIQYVQDAITQYMADRVDTLSKLIDGQLQELGGHQSYDYVALNRKVIQSGIIYGMGVLRGPYAVKSRSVIWDVGEDGTPTPKASDIYKPMYEFLPVWDFYPDLSAKTFDSMDGYFTRVVMSRAQVRKLCDRQDFFSAQIKKFLQRNPQGNYRPQAYEQELRSMGVKVNVNEMKTETMKYEVVVWHGQTSGEYLRMAGCDIPDDKLSDDLDAEIWMLDGNVIKAALNPWRELDCDMKTIHVFLFDEDDTSPIGFGLPNAIRDSQMAISASTRMLLDNASVVCGPNLELNTDLLRPDQDLTSISAYKVWYREGTGPEAQFPAVRNVEVNSHLADLLKIIELFMKFADTETFVGPATGGDMAQTPSEPMRTAAGASMMRGDAALPFKDIVRSFDRFTQSLIDSMVQFNKTLNPEQAPEGEYDVIARGATSLIAKEIRGAQADQLAQSITDDEKIWVDGKKLFQARIRARDMDDIMVSDAEAARRQQQQDQQAQQQAQQSQAVQEATVRKLLSDAFKNISQGQKNTAMADTATVKGALDLLEKGLTNAGIIANEAGGAGQPALPPPGGDGGGVDPGAGGPPAGGGQV